MKQLSQGIITSKINIHNYQTMYLNKNHITEYGFEFDEKDKPVDENINNFI